MRMFKLCSLQFITTSITWPKTGHDRQFVSNAGWRPLKRRWAPHLNVLSLTYITLNLTYCVASHESQFPWWGRLTRHVTVHCSMDLLSKPILLNSMIGYWPHPVVHLSVRPSVCYAVNCGAQGRCTLYRAIRCTSMFLAGKILCLCHCQACRGYGYPWIYPWILRWHNTIALNLCKIPASYKLLTNCTLFNDNLFLPRDASAERGNATVSRPSVRPSVRLSVCDV